MRHRRAGQPARARCRSHERGRPLRPRPLRWRCRAGAAARPQPARRRALSVVALCDHQAVLGPAGSTAISTRSSAARASSGADFLAEQTADASRPKGDSPRRLVNRIGVDHADRDARAGPFGEQLRRSVRAEPCQPRFLALLEPRAGLAAQRVALRRAPDRDRIEDGRLDDRRGGRLGHLAVGATHHPGEPDRALRIGDDQGLGRQRPLNVIERDDPLAFPGRPDDDHAAGHGRGVEDVDRLAQLEHHVVARVDGVRDRAHARRRQAGAER